MRVVAGVDHNASALRTFSRNFPLATAIEGSVRSNAVIERCAAIFDEAGAQSRRIVVSGPPCQGFSAAGSRDPLDSRNQIFVEVARAIARLQPDCALVENVSMVLAEKNAERVTAFQYALTEGGYYISHFVLDASDFGIPQRRKRTFFLVTRAKIERDDVSKQFDAIKIAVPTVKEALAGLPSPIVRPVKYCDTDDSGVVPNHLAMRHSAAVKRKIAKIEPGTGPMSYRRLHPTRISNTLFSGHRAPPAHFEEARSITVREAARLQGFPDSFRIYGSFANQMEQVTNAVPPALAAAVLTVLLANLGEHHDGKG